MFCSSPAHSNISLYLLLLLLPQTQLTSKQSEQSHMVCRDELRFAGVQFDSSVLKETKSQGKAASLQTHPQMQTRVTKL